MRISPPLAVDGRDARVLRGWVERGGVPGRRARIVLLSGQGWGSSAIAQELGCSKQTVITWRERFRAEGLAGLRDAPRSGRPSTVDATEVLLRTLEGPPPEIRRWSTRTLAAALGISNVAVANVWRSWGVLPGPGGQVSLATEPAFAGPVLGVAGMYVDCGIRLLAVLVDAPDAGASHRLPLIPVRLRDGPALRADGLGAAAGDPAGFLAGLAGAGGRCAVLVDGTEPIVGPESPAHVHRLPPGLSWDRLVRVVCLLAGASTAGRASVATLCDVLARHSPGRCLSWTAPPAIYVQEK